MGYSDQGVRRDRTKVSIADHNRLPDPDPGRHRQEIRRDLKDGVQPDNGCTLFSCEGQKESARRQPDTIPLKTDFPLIIIPKQAAEIKEGLSTKRAQSGHKKCSLRS